MDIQKIRAKAGLVAALDKLYEARSALARYVPDPGEEFIGLGAVVGLTQPDPDNPREWVLSQSGQEAVVLLMRLDGHHAALRSLIERLP